MSPGSYTRTLVQGCRPDSRQAAGLIKCSHVCRGNKTQSKGLCALPLEGELTARNDP